MYCRKNGNTPDERKNNENCLFKSKTSPLSVQNAVLHTPRHYRSKKHNIKYPVSDTLTC